MSSQRALTPRWNVVKRLNVSFNLHCNPVNLAKFYREIYQLQEMEKPADDPSPYLTDGRMTMIISPWAITDFEGAGIEPRHMDHLRFRVEASPPL